MSIEEQIWAHIEPRMRELVREEVSRRFDRPVTRKWIEEKFGRTKGTIANWEKTGKIKRINPPGAHPLYSMNEVMGVMGKI